MDGVVEGGRSPYGWALTAVGCLKRWGAYKRWVPRQPGYLENLDTSYKNVTSRGTVVKLQEGSNLEVRAMPS
jgi:hypothetical protein